MRIRHRSLLWIIIMIIAVSGVAATGQAGTVVIDLPLPPTAKDSAMSVPDSTADRDPAPGEVALAAYRHRAAPRTTYGFAPRSAGWYGSRSYYGYPYGTSYGYCGTGIWPYGFVSHTHRGFRPVSHPHHHGHSGFRTPPVVE